MEGNVLKTSLSLEKYDCCNVENIDIVYEESILIADSVVHVDTCNNGTTVFLNEKGQLYEIGNNIGGQLGVPIGETDREYL